MDNLNLRTLWEAFLKLPDRKFEALDKFLWVYCQKWKQSDVEKEQLKFGDAKAVCNLLAQEFLSDIHRVCSQSDDDNDTSQLQAYLLNERGWRILFVMHKLDVQSLTCGRELGTLLVSLLPWCLKFDFFNEPVTKGQIEHDFELTVNLEDCFSCLSKYTPHHTVHLTRKHLHTCARKSKSSTIFQRRAEYSVRKSFIKTSHETKKDSSDSGDESNSKSSKRRRYRRFKSTRSKSLYHSLTHPFSQHQLEDGDNLDGLLSEIVMDSCTNQSPIEFCCLVLQIVNDLCLADSQPLSPTKTISSTIMPQLLQILPYSGEGDHSLDSHCLEKSRQIFHLQLLHVVLTASAMTVGLQNGVNILVGHRVIPFVLKAAGSLGNTNTASTEESSCDLCFKFMSHSVLGCLKLIEAVFQYLPFNLTFIRNAVNLMEEFRSHNGFEMLSHIVLVDDASCCSHHATGTPFHEIICDALRVTADIMSTLKITKVNYIHTMTCLKKKHRKCQFSQYLDHHHDILGPIEGSKETVLGASSLIQSHLPTTTPPRIESDSQNESTCLVAMLAEFLLKLLPKLLSKQIQLQTLSALYSTGVCCCLSPELLVDVVIQSALSTKFSVKGHLFEIMCRLLLEQLFAGSTSNSVVCTVCSMEETFQPESNEPLSNTLGHLIADSGFSSNEALQLSLQQKQELSKWKALTKLKQLVFAEDLSLATLTMRHLCLLAIKGNSSVKKQLFFNIIFVVFQLFRQKRLDSEESSGSEFQLGLENRSTNLGTISFQVIHHCLAALPYLLQEEEILKAFLNKKGLQKLCCLLAENTLRQVVLKVLEALVIFDEKRIGKAGQMYVSTVSSLHFSSSSSIQTSLSESTESIGVLVMKSILNILFTKAKAFNAIEPDDNNRRHLLKDSSFDADSYDSETSDSVGGNVELQKLEQLTILTDLWNTCCFLCQKSVGFFKTFLESDPSVASLSYEKLREVVTSLSLYSSRPNTVVDQYNNEQTKLSESMLMFKHRLDLTEALLGVCFVASSSPLAVSSENLKQVSQLKDFLVEAFLLCQNLDSIRLKLLLDMLLSCCSILPKRTNRQTHRLDSNDDTGDELLGQFASSSSDNDSGTFNTEVGYESDSESSYTEPVNRGNGKFTSVPEKDVNDLDALAPIHAVLVKVLVNFKQLPTANSLVPYTLQKIVQGIQSNRWHADAMCSQGCLEELITGFEDTIVSLNPEDKEKQSLLLELIQLLAQNEISSQQLQHFLRLFQNEQAPVSSLLSLLLAVVETYSISPHYYLSYPVKKQQDLLSPYRVPNKLDFVSRNVWNISSLCHNIDDNLSWNTFQVAFTLTLWVAVKDSKVTTSRSNPSTLYSTANGRESAPFRRGKTDLLNNMEGECCHVVSIGTTEKLFEVWVNLRNGSLILRLTSDMLDGDHILTECDWSGILAQDKWHHLVIMYSEKLDGSTLVGKASLVVDGSDVRDFPLDHPALKVTFKVPSILIGHSIDNTLSDWLAGKLSLGNIMLFKGCPFSCDTCFHLFTLGPDNTSITKCDCSSQKYVYCCHLDRKVVLHSQVSHDVLVGIKSVTLTEAQESLILMFSPKSSNVFSVYSQTRPTELSSVAGNINIPTHLPVLENRLLVQRPDLIPAKVTGQNDRKFKVRMEQSIQQAGGIGIFLFLVAKVYELSGIDSGEVNVNSEHREQLQSLVTRLFLTILQHMPYLSAQCDEMSGYSMLAKVLATPQSHVGYHTLKALFDACTTESILRFDRVSGRCVMRKNTEALVRNVQVVEKLLLGWRIWISAPPSLLETLYAGLELLVRGDHPHQEFNVKQFHSIGITQKMFLVYQERLQEGYPALPPSISQSVISICKSMMGHPPDSHMIMSVFDFLLIMHPAVNTYVHNQKESYHFNLWWNTPSNMSEKSVSTEVHANRNLSRTYSSRPLYDEEDPPQHDPETVILRKSASMPSAPLAISRSGRSQQKGYETLSSEGSDIEEETSGRQRSSSYPPVTITPGVEGADEAQSMVSVDKENQPISFVATQEDSSMVNDPPSSTTSSVSVENRDKSKEEGSEGVPLKDEGITQSESVDEQLSSYPTDEAGVETLCEGLLELLYNVIDTLPEDMLQSTLTRIIRPEVLIILIQNQSAVIRAAVLKLLGIYLSKAPKEQQEGFIRLEGFKLVGNQLHQYPAGTEIIQLTSAMVCGQAVNIGLNMAPVTLMSITQRGAISLLLGLLDKTVNNPTLCQNTVYILSQIFESSPFVAGALLEFGLVETLCNLMVAIHGPNFSGSYEQKQILLDTTHHLMVIIALREFSTSGLSHFQQFEDLLTLLKTLEQREESIYGKNSFEALSVQSVQWKILQRILEYLERSGDGREDAVSHFHNVDSPPGFNSLKTLLMPSFLTSRSAKAESSNINNMPRLPNATTNQTPAFSSQSLSPTHKPAERFSVQRKLSAVLDFIMDGSDSMFVGTLAGLENVGLHGMTTDHTALGAGSSPYKYSGLESQAPDKKVSSKVSAPSIIDPSPSSTWTIQMFSSKKKQVVPVTASELLDRLKKTIVMAVNLVLYADHTDTKKAEREKKTPLLFVSSKETALESFHKFLYSFLLTAFISTLEKTFFGRKKNVIMWNAKDALKTQFGRLLTLTISPSVSFESRLFALSYLATNQHYAEVLRLLLTNHQQGAMICVYVHELLTKWRDRLNSFEVEEGCKIVTTLRQAGFNVPSTDPNSSQAKGKEASVQEDIRVWDVERHKAKEGWKKKQATALSRILTKYDSISSKISAKASEVTQLVTQLQNVERKKFFDHIKRSMSSRIQIKKCWQDLIQQLTHERAVWYSKDSAAQSWQLDPTEGPCRVRRRLQRCHLGLEKRFLKPEFRYKIDTEATPAPLIYLFEDDHQTSDSAALIYRLYTNEKIQHTCKCTAVTPANETKGEILIGENCVYFVADEAMSDVNYTQVLLGNKDQLSMTWPHVDIKEIHKRRYQLQNIALEIFLTNGKTCLLAFESQKERDELAGQLNNMELPNLIAMENNIVTMENLIAIQQLWLEGHMTNFEYLTHLNTMAGRSFNDLMQYPVFPFVLKDYVSKSLDLNNQGVFRDLSKPIAVQDKTREQKYVDNYNYLKVEYERSLCDEDSVMYQVTPYHYGSHYSNSGTVLQFLVRLPPFTKMFLSYQDNNFDIPDRTFHSMNTAWRLSSYESTTDVKELIPEFFFLPDFLQNKEGYNFGKRQTGEDVSDVSLPPWCCQDARHFILIHRQALESDIVSQSLHEWIDLVFGYKQQGEMAIKSVNVFHPSTYFGVDVEGIKDPVRRHAMKTMIKTYGQTPKQLFKSPHPPRALPNENKGMGLDKITQLFSKSPSASNQSTQQLKGILTDDTMSPCRQVLGLSWGQYVGSPDCPDPVPVWQTHYNNMVASLVSLRTGPVFGIGPNSCLLIMYSKEKGVISMTSTEVKWAAIISWAYPDSVLRIRNKQDKPAVNFLFEDSTNEVCSCASLPDCRLLFTGGTTGVITVYNTSFNAAKESDMMVMGHSKHLYGHSGAVNHLQVCWPYSILVSASEDHTCIIWDLNRLTYVNSITSHTSAIKSVAVSETLGDIATVSDDGMGSSVQLHTVNGDPIVSTYCQQTVNCLAFSSAPEGRSVNVIAGGLSSGVVRLWSCWDLCVVRDLQDPSLLAKPVISLTFTFDNQLLYMSTADGSVTIWESSSPGKTRRTPLKFTPFT